VAIPPIPAPTIPAFIKDAELIVSNGY